MVGQSAGIQRVRNEVSAAIGAILKEEEEEEETETDTESETDSKSVAAGDGVLQSGIALDCYVDADYAGHWISSEADSPETVKSHAGYIISLGNAPVLLEIKAYSRALLVCYGI
eukprot:scaffold8535_cov99-Amphora_coffeaeformis.AAC.3